MSAASALPLFAGRRFRVRYDGLAADNVYSADGRHVQYAIVSGAYAGAQGDAACQWQQISEGVYAISWQEADGATVVHVDDFVGGRSLACSPPPMAVSIACKGRCTRCDAGQRPALPRAVGRLRVLLR